MSQYGNTWAIHIHYIWISWEGQKKSSTTYKNYQFNKNVKSISFLQLDLNCLRGYSPADKYRHKVFSGHTKI